MRSPQPLRFYFCTEPGVGRGALRAGSGTPVGEEYLPKSFCFQEFGEPVGLFPPSLTGS